MVGRIITGLALRAALPQAVALTSHPDFCCRCMNTPPPLIATPAMLGELLAAQGLVQPAEVARALAFQQQAGGRLGGVLVRMGRMRLRA